MWATLNFSTAPGGKEQARQGGDITARGMVWGLGLKVLGFVEVFKVLGLWCLGLRVLAFRV